MARSRSRAARGLLALTLLLALALQASAQSSSSSSASASSLSADAGSDASASASASSSGSSERLRSDTAMGVFHGLDGREDISAGPGVLAAAGILLGAVANIAGFRLLKPIVGIGAFIAGGYLISYVVERAVGEGSNFVVLSSWIAFGVGGLVVAGAAVTINKIGFLAVGGCAGVLFAGLLNVGIGHKIDADEPDRLLLVLQVVLGFLFALAALDSVCLIISLSFCGTFILMYGIGYFAGSFPIGDDLDAYRKDNATEAWLSAVPVAWWIYLAVFLVVFGLGLYVQLAKARENGYYDENGKFVYAAYSDDDQERSNNRHVNDGDDDNERKSPNHANFQNFAPYQPPASYAAGGYAPSSSGYPSSNISYNNNHAPTNSSRNAPSNAGSSHTGRDNGTINSNRSGGSSSSRRPASTYSQPYTSYYTRPSSSQRSQPSRGYQGYA